MTWLIVAIVVAVVLVLAGGTLAGIRPYLENRASRQAIALQEQQAQTAAREAEVESRRAAADAQMRTDPVPILVATLARYDEQVRIPRSAAVNAANVIRLERAREYAEASLQLPPVLHRSGIARFAALAAVPLFIAASVAAGVLDFVTFSHLGGSGALAVTLSALMVLFMTTSAAIIGLGSGWLKGLTGPDWPRPRRRVITRAGIVLALVGTVSMTWIASGEFAAASGRWPAVLDRISMGAITLVQVPLTIGVVFGVQVLMLARARRRRDEAQQHYRAAVDAAEQADARLYADLFDLLAPYGHGGEKLRQALNQLQEFGIPWTGLLDEPPTPDTVESDSYELSFTPGNISPTSLDELDELSFSPADFDELLRLPDTAEPAPAAPAEPQPTPTTTGPDPSPATPPEYPVTAPRTRWIRALGDGFASTFTFGGTTHTRVARTDHAARIQRLLETRYARLESLDRPDPSSAGPTT
ncbi:hypothetical protein ACFXHA_03325 [Nocardia sp. NPDC059240]|uniref:hypothetical protein n=1 Tax=Nocardia sp. NPDC059240 TaxID=3346786 RepID=UPI0036C0A367